MNMDDYSDKLLEYGIATAGEIDLVTRINGWSYEALEDILYARTGYRSLNAWLSFINEN